MTDIVSAQVRSRMMAGIRGKNTKPEVLIRSGLHQLGFRFRLHARSLPGRPDLVLRRHNAAVFINGCFWHGHDCSLFRLPGTRQDFWATKITANQQRDARTIRELGQLGWRISTIWECALRGRDRIGEPAVLKQLSAWLISNRRQVTIRGRISGP